jgi:MoaA/NifB/PqqE/SkfB family radical SAM enzyme
MPTAAGLAISPTGARFDGLRLAHTPPALRRSRLLTAYDLAKVGFFLFGMPANAFGSIDVSKECNLRCRHCYFFEQDYEGELTVDEWIEKLETLRRTTSRTEFPFFQCTWVGGEPLIRKDLIERGRKYFRHNTVVTNGTIPLPDWPDVHFYISIDGDEKTHEHIRKKKGIYQRAMRNLAEHPELEVTIAYCITRDNAHCIEEAVVDWARAGAARMTFDFYTPIETIEEPLFLPLEERDRVLDELLALKRVYGDFFVLPERAFRLMKSDVCRQVTDDCLFAKKSFALGPDGTPKPKCMMGEKADCDRCGCVVPFYLASLVDRRLIARDLAAEWSRAARRAAQGVVTAVLG